MSYARNIGRVGALAVALGIGYAVSDATAFALPATNSSGDSESAQTSSTRPSAKGRAAVGTGPRATTRGTADSRPRPAAATKPVRVAPVSVAVVSAPAQSVRAPAAAAAPPRAATASARLLSADAVSVLPSTGTGDSPAAAPLTWTAPTWNRRAARGSSVRTGTAALTATSLVPEPMTLSQGPNLLTNPGAEVGDPSLSGNSSVTVPGWTVTGTPTVIGYGTPRNSWPLGTSFAFPDLPSFMGFPKSASGPADGGAQFFGGGNVGDATLTQTVDLTAAGAAIDLGGVSYNLSGWLGGWLLNSSAASVKVDFLDDNKTYLGSADIGPVGVLERFFQTGLRERETSGVLPQGTRYAEVVVDLDQRALINIGINAAYNSAFADNISFSIGADVPAPPDPTPAPSSVGELDHVFMVYMENKGYDSIVGSPNAPFLNSLINAYGFANNYYGLTHGSLPNYYPVVGGSDFGITYNCAAPCIDATTTLVSNIDDAGKTWRSYAQSLAPGGNPLESSGDYAVDQTPFPAFTSIASDPAYAKAHIVPLEQMAIDLSDPSTAPDFAWFAANEDFNGEGPVDFPWGMLRFALSQLSPDHQYNVPALDQFLSETVPVVLNSETWKTTKSVLVVTFDEDNNNTSLGFGNEGNHVVTVVIPSPLAVSAGGMRGGSFTATNHYNHYSLLRMIEEALDLPTLTDNDKYAAPMNEFWIDGIINGGGSVL